MIRQSVLTKADCLRFVVDSYATVATCVGDGSASILEEASSSIRALVVEGATFVVASAICTDALWFLAIMQNFRYGVISKFTSLEEVSIKGRLRRLPLNNAFHFIFQLLIR